MPDQLTMPIAGIKVGERFRKNLRKLEDLRDSIELHDLLHPIVITPDHKLISGQRRLEACKMTKRYATEVPVRIVDLDKIINGEHDENTFREDFLPSEAVAIAKALIGPERKAAKERHAEGVKHGGETAGKGRAKESSGGTSPTPERAPRAADRVAAACGMDRKTLGKANEVVAAAKAEPEKYGDLVEEMDRTGRVNGAARKLKVRQQAEKLDEAPPPPPDGPYDVIVADPPWTYDNRADDPSHRAANPYASMSMDDIKAYLAKYPTLPAENCILWLWTTNSHMREAFDVLDAWGFTHKTILTWVKDRMGTGDWLRGQTEHCLLAVRGKPTHVLTNQTTAISGPLTKHSKKPDSFYALVRKLCPGSRLELFSRQPRKGFAVAGLEIQ